MTYPSELGDDNNPVTPAPTPIDVRIVPSDEDVTVRAATFGSWMTVSWAAGAKVTDAGFPAQILPLDRNRRQAQIVVQIAAGYVLVGSRKQISNGQGGQLTSGRYPVANIEELFVAPDGTNAAVVTVLNERD